MCSSCVTTSSGAVVDMPAGGLDVDHHPRHWRHSVPVVDTRPPLSPPRVPLQSTTVQSSTITLTAASTEQRSDQVTHRAGLSSFVRLSHDFTTIIAHTFSSWLKKPNIQYGIDRWTDGRMDGRTQDRCTTLTVRRGQRNKRGKCSQNINM